MKLRWIALLGPAMLVLACSQEPTELKNEKDKVNYGIGVAALAATSSSMVWTWMSTWW